MNRHQFVSLAITAGLMSSPALLMADARGSRASCILLRSSWQVVNDRLWFLIPLLWLLFVQPTQAAESNVLALTHATVIDGTGTPAQADVTVLVTGDRITAIGASASLRLPANAVVVDANGKFLIPGLWDMHVHWYDKEYLPLFLANGVTGIRLM